MAKFYLESTDPKIDIKAIEAKSWSGALSQVLRRLKGNASPVNIRVNAEGQAEVWEDEGGEHLTLELDPDTGFEVLDTPSVEFLDAPLPGSGALQARAATSTDAARAERGILAIQAAETELSACDEALDLLMTIVPAESGSVLLLDGDELRFITVRGPKSEALTGKTILRDHGIAGAVASSGTALLVTSAREHEQHDHSVDAEVNHITRTLLAMPLHKESQVVGVVELLNPFGADTFTLDQQQFSVRVVNALSERL